MAVRNESVRLSLEDAGFTTGMARDAAMVAVLRKNLDELGGTSVRTTRSIGPLGNEIATVGTKSRTTGPEIDKLSGRLRLVRDLALTAGPALVPIGASALPLIAAGAAALGATAGGIVVAALAFKGLGDAFKALDEFQADRSAENLAKLRDELARIGPAGAQLVIFLDSLEPKLRDLQLLARAGLFPGVEAGIDDMLDRLPELRGIIISLSEALGDVAADAGQALAGDNWTPFFDFLKSEAAPILEGFLRSIGHLGETLANLLVAFTPLSRDFTGGLESMTAALASWSRGLGDNTDFQAFLAYLRESGPEVVDLLGSLAESFAAIVEAAAPYGAIVLPALTALADVLTLIAGSDIGTPLLAGAAAMIAFNRSTTLMKKITGSEAVTSLKGLSSSLTTVTSAQDRARLSADQLTAAEAKRSKATSAGLRTIGKGGAVLGGLAIAASGAAEGLGLTNTASLALMGTVGGPWGAAIGAGVGLLLDWRARSQESSAASAEFTATLDEQTGALTENTRALAVKKLEEADALSAAKDLGLSLSLVTDAALGNAAAMDQVNQVLEEYDRAHPQGGHKGRVTDFARQQEAAQLLGDTLGDVSGAVSDSQDEFNRQTSAMGSTTRQTNDLRHAYDLTASAAEGLAFQLEILDGFLNKRSTFRAYEASLDALRKSLKDAPHAFSEMNEAGRTNLDNLDAILANTAHHLDTIADPHRKAQFLNSVIDTLRQIGKTSPEAAAAVREVIPALRDVKDANQTVVIKADNADALKKATITRLAIRDLHVQRATPVIAADDSPFRKLYGSVKGAMREADKLRARPTVDVDAGNSFSILTSIANAVDNIDPYKLVTIQVKRAGDALTGFYGSAPAGADGMTVPGQRRPYGDKLLIYAAPGEEIISNRFGQADQFRADRAAGRIPRYADGGTAGKDPHNKMRDSVVLPANIAELLDTAKGAARALRLLEGQVDRSKKALDREAAKRDELASAMSSLSSAVAGKFDLDLGAETETSPWAAGGGAPSISGQVDQLAAQAMAMPGIIAALQQAGLSGPALAEALQEMSFEQLQALAANPTQAATLGTSLGALAAAQQGAGSAAGQAVYGAAYAAQQKVFLETRDEVREGNRLLRAVEAAVKAMDDNNQAGHRGTQAAAGQGSGQHSSGSGRQGVGPR